MVCASLNRPHRLKLNRIFVRRTRANDQHHRRAGDYVRIPKSIHPSEISAVLSKCAPEGDEVAMAIAKYIDSYAITVTDVQRDTAWAKSRHLSMTGSQAHRIIRQVLLTCPGEYPLVRKALLRMEETIEVENSTAVDESVPVGVDEEMESFVASGGVVKTK